MSRELREAYRAYLRDPQDDLAIENYARLLSHSANPKYRSDMRYDDFVSKWMNWGDDDYTYGSQSEFEALFYESPNFFPNRKVYTPPNRQGIYYYLLRESRPLRRLVAFDNIYHGPVSLNFVLTGPSYETYEGEEYSLNMLDRRAYRWGILDHRAVRKSELRELDPATFTQPVSYELRQRYADLQAALFFGLITEADHDFVYVEPEVPAP